MKELNKWVKELQKINPNRTVDEYFEAMHGAYSKDKIKAVLSLDAMVEDKPVNLRIGESTIELELDHDAALDEEEEDRESS